MEKKSIVKIGDRVELMHMEDTLTRLQPGDQGTVIRIEEDDSEFLIWVSWDNGETLALLGDTDKFKVLKQ